MKAVEIEEHPARAQWLDSKGVPPYRCLCHPRARMLAEFSPLPKLFIKTENKIGAKIDLCRTPLFTVSEAEV